MQGAAETRDGLGNAEWSGGSDSQDDGWKSGWSMKHSERYAEVRPSVWVVRLTGANSPGRAARMLA